MTKIDHFYECFGCGRRHEAEAAAVTCCAVVREIFECLGCRERFPSAAKAAEHMAYVGRRMAADFERAMLELEHI